MPDIPSANTHIPTIMIAERISSLLLTHDTGVTS
jgi:choline dehydrogenase-like flavoprotein